jgi:hypothetical protein
VDPRPTILEQGRVAAAGVALLRGRAAMVPPASAGQDNRWLGRDKTTDGSCW